MPVDETTLKVIAGFTEVGEFWPSGAWVCIVFNPDSSWRGAAGWYIADTYHRRYPDELSELEANQKHIFRDKSRLDKSYTVHNK